MENGRAGAPSPVDRNTLEVQNAFADLTAPIPAGDVTARVGRQELAYGSGRLIDVRDGPNVRRTFDGARVFLGIGNGQIDGFMARPRDARTGAFDDHTSDTVTLWGLYGSNIGDVYGPAGQIIAPPDGGASFVGTALSASADYAASEHLSFGMVYTHIWPGPVIDALDPSRDIDFVELTAHFRF